MKILCVKCFRIIGCFIGIISIILHVVNFQLSLSVVVSFCYSTIFGEIKMIIANSPRINTAV